MNKYKDHNGMLIQEGMVLCNNYEYMDKLYYVCKDNNGFYLRSYNELLNNLIYDTKDISKIDISLIKNLLVLMDDDEPIFIWNLINNEQSFNSDDVVLKKSYS